MNINTSNVQQHQNLGSIHVDKVETAPQQKVTDGGSIVFGGHTYRINYISKDGQISPQHLQSLAKQALQLISKKDIHTLEGDVLKISNKQITHISGEKISNVKINQGELRALQKIFQTFSQSLSLPEHEKSVDDEDLMNDFNPQHQVTLKNVSSTDQEISKLTQPVQKTVSPATSKKAGALLKVTSEAKQKLQDKFSGYKNAVSFMKNVVLDNKTKVEIVKDAFGKTTFTFEHEGKQVVVNEFSKIAYRGPQHADFKDRLSLLYKSLEVKIGELGKSNPENKVKLQLILKKLNEKAAKDLDISAEKYKNIDPTKKEGKQNFKKAVEGAEDILGQVIVQASILFSDVQGAKVSIDELKEAEIDYVTTHPRPTVVNQYDIEFQGKTKTFISMQQPRSQENQGNTTPSSNRKIPGLVNYVSTSHGVIESDGQVRITYEGIRHSSYPPIAIKDKVTRQKITLDNVKEGLRDLARDKGVNEKNDKQNPLVISLRTMMLLTPKIKAVDDFRKEESETRMLKESYGALMALDGKTFQVDIDGKSVWIKPNIKVMNLGINKGASPEGGLIGKIPNDPLHDEVNEKGFNEFIQEVGDHVKKFVASDGVLSGKVNKMRGLLEHGLEGINGAIRKNVILMKKSEKELGKIKQELKEPQDEEGKKLIEDKNTVIKSCKENIKGLYKNLQKGREENFSKFGNEYQELAKEIAGDLRTMAKKNPEASKMADLVLASTHGIGLYLSKEHKKLDKIMDFQSDFLIAHQLMGNSTEFFCKSAEDRTGNQNNRVEEQLIYREFTGRLPLSSEDKSLVRSSFSSKVHMYSASQDNTFFNSYARGLQVGGDTNKDYSDLAKTGKSVAGLAKGPFKLAKKMMDKGGASSRIKEIRSELGLKEFKRTSDRENVQEPKDKEEDMPLESVQKELNITTKEEAIKVFRELEEDYDD